MVLLPYLYAPREISMPVTTRARRVWHPRRRDREGRLEDCRGPARVFGVREGGVFVLERAWWVSCEEVGESACLLRFIICSSQAAPPPLFLIQCSAGPSYLVGVTTVAAVVRCLRTEFVLYVGVCV